MVHSAMLQYRLNSSTAENSPDFALINAGGIRATIDAGPITRGEILTAFPFGNAIVEVPVSGERLWKVFEGIIAGLNVENGKAVTSFVQVSKGVVIKYKPDELQEGAGNYGKGKLVSVKINGKLLDKTKQYKIVTLDFIATGGDNFFSEKFDNLVLLDTLDEVVVKHIGAVSPVEIALEGRIKEVSDSCKKRRKARGLKKRAM